MSALIALLLALQPSEAVSFAGGTAAQLVRALARQEMAPAAVFADPRDRIPSFLGIPRKELDAKRLAKESGLSSLGETLALSSQKLPGGFLYRRAYDEYVASIPGTAALATKEGKIVIKGDHPWVRIGDLQSLELSKPLRVHWAWRSAYVAVTPGRFSEVSLLKAISDALGAPLTMDVKGYDLGFDAAAHRKRSLARYRETAWGPSSPLKRDDYLLHRSVYVESAALLSDDEWAALYAKPDTQFCREGVPMSDPVGRAALQGFRRFVDGEAKRGADNASVGDGILNRIQQTGKGAIMALPDGRFSFAMPYGDGGFFGF